MVTTLLSTIILKSHIKYNAEYIKVNRQLTDILATNNGIQQALNSLWELGKFDGFSISDR